MMMLVAWGGAEPAAAQDHTRVKNPAVRGEQSPPAAPGQNNFGGADPGAGRRRAETAGLQAASGTAERDRFTRRHINERPLHLC